MKIKVKLFNNKCKFKIKPNGDFIDLCSAINVEYKAPIADRLTKNKSVRKVNFEKIMIPLGIGMKLPEGYEAVIVPRSSSFKNFGFIQANHFAVIDGGKFGYCGPNDQWFYPIIPLQDGKICEGDRVCQFRIQLSQKATMWQKIKWLFTNKIEFEFVNNYDGIDRGGEGTSGVK